jgi:hypothetical protein
MEAYDFLSAPDPDEWLSTDEHERIALVMECHRDARVKLPNERIHAVIHVVVENQIALGDELPVQATLERLINEGLDRHDAIHAVGSVLVRFMHDLLGEGDAAPSANEKFYEELKNLKAAEWLKSFR